MTENETRKIYVLTKYKFIAKNERCEEFLGYLIYMHNYMPHFGLCFVNVHEDNISHIISITRQYNCWNNDVGVKGDLHFIIIREELKRVIKLDA